jgi:cytoskeletal protein CcmA (bactofilin family)
MATTAQIGKTIHIKGTVTSDEPLTIAGSVEGSVTVNGHALTVTEDGSLNADATADTILIEGTAKGQLKATTRMTLRPTSTVTGDIHAPTLSIAEGAKIHGRIDAGARKSTRQAGPTAVGSDATPANVA